MSPRQKLSPLQETEARRVAAAEAKANKKERTFPDEEKAKRKERVEKAKDALKRSAELKGDHVPPARKSLKTFLQNLNGPNQPDDARFEMMVEAPFKVPPKKKTNDRRFSAWVSGAAQCAARRNDLRLSSPATGTHLVKVLATSGTYREALHVRRYRQRKGQDQGSCRRSDR